MSRRNYSRETIARRSDVRCLECPQTWGGNAGIAAGVAHAVKAAHIVEAAYSTQLRYVPATLTAEPTAPCPACGVTSYVSKALSWAGIDRYVHADGTSAAACWASLGLRSLDDLAAGDGAGEVAP